ncbi:MAG: T9SS type A sorting domain-containing protein [Minisyncoccia bacterium]
MNKFLTTIVAMFFAIQSFSSNGLNSKLDPNQPTGNFCIDTEQKTMNFTLENTTNEDIVVTNIYISNKGTLKAGCLKYLSSFEDETVVTTINFIPSSMFLNQTIKPGTSKSFNIRMSVSGCMFATIKISIDSIYAFGAKTLTSAKEINQSLVGNTFVVKDCSLSGIEKNTNKTEFKIFPNPVSDKINIPNFSGDLIITDMHGKILLKINSEESVSTIDVAFLDDGFYWVLIPEENRSIKFAKIH